MRGHLRFTRFTETLYACVDSLQEPWGFSARRLILLGNEAPIDNEEDPVTICISCNAMRDKTNKQKRGKADDKSLF